MSVGAINILVDNEDSHNLLNCLQDSRAQLRGVTPQCADGYMRKLREMKVKKSQSGMYWAGCLSVTLDTGDKIIIIQCNSTSYEFYCVLG
jgi:hypothetical protein